MLSTTTISHNIHSASPIAQLGRAAFPLAHTRSAIPRQHAALWVGSANYSSTAGTPSRPFSSKTQPHPIAPFSFINPVPHNAAKLASAREFSTTRIAKLRDFFPPQETKFIRQTPPAWVHHGYTEAEMVNVETAHREPKNMGDWFAWKLIRFCRVCMDLATGLRPEQQVDKKNPTTAVEAAKPLTEAQWLVRFVFLESIAGVPGMVAGMLRHLRSLRRMKRDNGWIETLLEESYNERMHLLTFMKMCEPGWFMKTMILGAQGVFFNALFFSYLISPKICHRFVGYLEEEAVHTYTRCIREIDQGMLEKWSDPDFKIPDMAVQYWNMPEGKRTMKDLIMYIRADEAVHRGVNHTLSNLNYKEDPNPFVSDYKTESSGHKPKAVLKPAGYERNEVIG